MNTQAKYLFLMLQGDSSTAFPATDCETYIAH